MGSKKVRMKARSASPEGTFREGDIRECSDEKARQLVENNQAEYVEGEPLVEGGSDSDESQESNSQEQSEAEEDQQKESDNESDYSFDTGLSIDELMDEGEIEQHGAYYTIVETDENFHGRDALEEHLNE